MVNDIVLFFLLFLMAPVVIRLGKWLGQVVIYVVVLLVMVLLAIDAGGDEEPWE